MLLLIVICFIRKCKCIKFNFNIILFYLNGKYGVNDFKIFILFLNNIIFLESYFIKDFIINSSIGFIVCLELYNRFYIIFYICICL